MFFLKRRFLASSLSPYHLSEVHFFKHFIQKSLYTALEMRYTTRARVAEPSHSSARGSRRQMSCNLKTNKL